MKLAPIKLFLILLISSLSIYETISVITSVNELTIAVVDEKDDVASR